MTTSSTPDEWSALDSSFQRSRSHTSPELLFSVKALGDFGLHILLAGLCASAEFPATSEACCQVSYAVLTL